ncbi:DUF6397 family protein [Streptomyces halstedii]|uniref:DUF6397 family protein n=1 Tax=Streptomyces halstedii TaxID=1944 RepID=UPI00345F25DB
MNATETTCGRTTGTYATRRRRTAGERAPDRRAVGPAAAGPAATVASGRAAQELGLKRGEFDLAVHLGLIGTETPPGGGNPRVGRAEIDRLRATAGFPDSLRDRLRTAGTAEAAALLGISPVRFTGLARFGCVSPVAFYLNRYRAVVWLYLVEELTAFAAREPELLGGRTPDGMRAVLKAGGDRRARNWRAHRTGRLLSRTADPWARAAVRASALDPVQLAGVVHDPYERSYLVRTRPAGAFGRPGSVSGREAMEQLMLADEPDEILWCRVNLVMELDRARESRPAPRPGDDRPRCGPAAVPPGLRVPPRPVGREGSGGHGRPTGARRPGLRLRLLSRLGLGTAARPRPPGRDR